MKPIEDYMYMIHLFGIEDERSGIFYLWCFIGEGVDLCYTPRVCVGGGG